MLTDNKVVGKGIYRKRGGFQFLPMIATVLTAGAGIAGAVAPLFAKQSAPSAPSYTPSSAAIQEVKPPAPPEVTTKSVGEAKEGTDKEKKVKSLSDLKIPLSSGVQSVSGGSGLNLPKL
jgi:hypothetical protein